MDGATVQKVQDPALVFQYGKSGNREKHKALAQICARHPID